MEKAENWTSRRDFLAATAGALAGLGCASASAKQIKLPAMVVDTHTHFYDPSRPDGVPWPPPGSPLYRSVLPDDWRVVAEPCRVTHTVVVEASPWLEDNQWILDLAANDKAIVGFVGNLDPMDPAFGQHLERFAANPIFRGIRVSGKKFTDHAGDEKFVSGMRKLADLGLSLDVNGGHPLLLRTAELAKAVPDLRVVVDHVGSAGDPSLLKDEWRLGIKAAGGCANVFCKVSGLPEQSKAEWGKARGDVDFYRPILDWVWQCFGADRVVYGSNWPVSDKGAAYGEMFAVVSEYFGEKGEAACRKFFLGNSRAAYRWRER